MQAKRQDITTTEFQQICFIFAKTKNDMNMIDLHILPRKAQNELIDFYCFLVDRYVSGKRKKHTASGSVAKEIDNFFDQYNYEVTEFSFNRNEVYER